MQVTIVDQQDALSPDVRASAERRLLFAFSRFAPKIQRVSLAISDVNGPRGGVDKACRVTIDMKRDCNIYSFNQAADVATAIARAVDRARRAVARAVDRDAEISRFPARSV